MHNENSLITILLISRTNIQYVIIAVKKVISHVNVILKRKTTIFQDLSSPCIYHNHHFITNVRRQGYHQVLVAYSAHVGVTTTILVFQITGMHPHHCNFHLYNTLDQKTDFRNPRD